MFQISQMDGTWDIDFLDEEDSNDNPDNENVISLDNVITDGEHLNQRVRLRNSLRKRRVELLAELSELESKKQKLCETKEV